MKIYRKTDEYAPVYHLYVDKGWINDPCGCSVFRGEYHIFFQYHEQPSSEGPGKWYHMKSPDMLNWMDLGVCLSPESESEKNGCWTGSGIEINDRHYLYYSMNQDGRIPQQQPGIAYSEDGIKYRKLPCNPIITEATLDGHIEMRDPKVFKRENKFYMLQGSNRKGKAEVVGYISEDGINWYYKGIFFSNEKWMGDMFECPDFFSINEKDFMILSPMNWEGHKNIIISGKADFEHFSFKCEKVVELDLGSDFYAAQSIPLKDGRVGIIGWLNKWGKPHPEISCGWSGMLSCLRIVHYDKNTGDIAFLPASELISLEKNHNDIWKTALGQGNKSIYRPNHLHKYIEMTYEIRKEEFNANIHFQLQGEKDVPIEIIFNFGSDLVIVDKTRAFEGDNSYSIIPVELLHKAKMIILMDGSSLEIFLGNGSVLSERFYSTRVCEMAWWTEAEIEGVITVETMNGFYN